jgi:hypothetical protein
VRGNGREGTELESAKFPQIRQEDNHTSFKRLRNEAPIHRRIMALQIRCLSGGSAFNVAEVIEGQHVIWNDRFFFGGYRSENILKIQIHILLMLFLYDPFKALHRTILNAQPLPL